MRKRVKVIVDPARDPAEWRQRLSVLAEQTLLLLQSTASFPDREEKVAVCQTARYLADSITEPESILFFEAITAIRDGLASR